MKFTTKKFMSLVFAAGLAAATLKPSTAMADDPFQGDGRTTTVVYRNAGGGGVCLDGEVPGADTEFWAVHAVIGYKREDNAQLRIRQPEVNWLTGRSATAVRRAGRVRGGTLLDVTMVGRMGAPLEVRLHVEGWPDGTGIPIVAEITTMLCSTLQDGVKIGEHGFPVLTGPPTDINQKPLVALIVL
jgi:hypothetical protein